MTRLFVDRILTIGQSLEVGTEDSHHLLHVLRTRIGDQVTVCDQTAADYQAEISEIINERVRLKLLGVTFNKAEPPIHLTLFQCLPKGDKFDSIIRHAVELGVCEIIPVSSERSVVRLNQQRAQKKIERWQTIAESAAKQSGRGIIPSVRPVLDFASAVREMRMTSCAFVPWEGERDLSLTAYLRETAAAGPEMPSALSFMIGPEGGLGQTEVNMLTTSGLTTVSLGPRILRTETAALCVLSILLGCFEL